jgi:hypothetical protein
VCSVRTPEQTEIVRFWTGAGATQQPRTLRALATERGLGLAETARMFALVHVSSAHALLACFDAKYHYLFWRPIHAIQRADTDDNPATESDPTWRALKGVKTPI